MRRWLLLPLLAVTSCRCGDSLVAAPSGWAVSPERLELGEVFVGQRVDAVLLASNTGKTPVTLDITGAPLELDTLATLAAGESHSLVLTFRPTTVGPFETRVTFSDGVDVLVVTVTADVRAAPACASGPCRSSHYEPDAGCVEEPMPDETACETRCVRGVCRAGECEGAALLSCDDGNACTTDACANEVGCVHQNANCEQPADSCSVGFCDPRLGCSAAPAADGTACGRNDCTSSQFAVCISGQCVTRAPPQGLCASGWRPLYPDDVDGVLVTDTRAQRLLLVHPSKGTLWERTLFGWSLLETPHRPSAARGVASFDELRGELVLVNEANETWLYDGSDWRLSGSRFWNGYPAMFDYAGPTLRLTYDRAHRVVMGAWALPGRPSMTVMLWDGTTWHSVRPDIGPSVRRGFALGFEPVAGEVLLFGGRDRITARNLDDTWAWDGTRWRELTPAHRPGLSGLVIAPASVRADTFLEDRAHQRLLVKPSADDAPSQNLWAWDGSDWVEQPGSASGPTARVSSQAAWDPARSVVTFGGGRANHSDVDGLTDWWDWNGAFWTLGISTFLPPRNTQSHRRPPVAFTSSGSLLVLESRSWTWSNLWAQTGGALATLDARGCSALDEARHQVVFVDDQTVTFEARFGNSVWRPAQPAHQPPRRQDCAMSFDAARGVVVLFGGIDPVTFAELGDLWEWDGVDWVERTQGPGPTPRSAHSMTWDPVNHRTLLVGSPRTCMWCAPEAWEWDGAQWLSLAALPEAAGWSYSSLVTDPLRQRVLVTGGFADRSSTGFDPNQPTFEFDGATWVEVPSLLSPNFNAPALVWDEARQRVVLFGGSGRDVWVYVP